MSVLHQQHQDWLEARERLGHRRPIMHPLIPVVALEEPAKVIPYGAPVDLLSPPSMKFIAKLVALKHGVTTEEMIVAGQVRAFNGMRNKAVFLIRTHTARSFSEIGSFFRRDHTTIIYAVEMFARQHPHLRQLLIDRDAAEIERRSFVDREVGRYIEAGWLSEQEIAAKLDVTQALVHSIASRRRKVMRQRLSTGSFRSECSVSAGPAPIDGMIRHG